MIIQFLHPGTEMYFSPRSIKNGIAYKFNSGNKSGLRCWNNEKSHKRKFMKSGGWYLQRGNGSKNLILKRGDIYFWGEWEPQSEFDLTGYEFSSQPSMPFAVHTPVFSPKYKGGSNTDPYVFGKTFYYTNCKQTKYKILRELEENSIVIFGSEKERRAFVVDTVFVVDTGELLPEAEKHIEEYPKLLREVTLELHKNGLNRDSCFYRGKMFDTTKKTFSLDSNEIFSFVPCKPAAQKNGIFERPDLDIKKFCLKKPGAYTGIKKIDGCETHFTYWKNLVNELLDKGLSLGVRIDEPAEVDNKKFADCKILKKNSCTNSRSKKTLKGCSC